MAARFVKFYLYKPDPAAVESIDNAAEALALTWLEACITGSKFNGSWEEEDVTDTCSNGEMEAQPTVRNTEITFEAFKKRTALDALPTWYVNLRNAWRNKEPIFILMLDGPRATVGSEGIWMLANVFNFTLDHPVKGGVKFEFSMKQCGTVTGVPKFDFLQVPA